jgi:uncharacterized MAPEG superfamily protein
MHELVALVTLASLILFMAMIIRVGAARHRFDVKAPIMTGPPEFERMLRVQTNTLEGLIVQLPALWLFALPVDRLARSDLGDLVALGLGLMWIVGRIIYMQSYLRDPASRSTGYSVQVLATIVLVIGGVVAAGWGLLKP